MGILLRYGRPNSPPQACSLTAFLIASLNRITRYLGCWTAYGLFAWRYPNIPDNWSYVASPWSVWLIGLTLGAETVYPFVYVWVWMCGDWKREARSEQSNEKREMVG